MPAKRPSVIKREGTTAADDQRQQDGEHGAADIGFMRTRQANAFHDQSPNAGNKAPTKRNNEQRLRRAGCETNDAQSGFVRFFRAADQHQTEMNNAGADKDTQRNQIGQKMITQIVPIAPPNIAPNGFRCPPIIPNEPRAA